MIGGLASRSASLLLSGVVLVLGGAAWVFSRQAAALGGSWTLPGLSLVAFVLALAIARQSRLLFGLMGVLGLTMLISWNPASATSTSHLAGACLGFLVMVMIEALVTTPGRLRLAILTFLAGGLFVMVVGLAGAATRAGTWLDALLPVKVPPIKLGLEGLNGEVPGDVNSNALAAVALLIVPLGVAAVMVRSRQRMDWAGVVPLGALTVVVGAFVMAVCRSRTAWLAVWLTFIALLVRGTLPWRTRLVVGAIVVAPFVGAISGVVASDREEFSLQAGAIWAGVKDRAEIMSAGVERWRQSPWLGIGLNEFRAVYRPKDWHDPATGIDHPQQLAHAHNIVLQTALDVGIIGSAAYWGLMVLVLIRADQTVRGASRLARVAALGSAVALVAVSLFGVADAVTLGAKVGLFQWMSAGMILAAWNLQGTARSESRC